VEKLFASWKPVEAAKKPVPLGQGASSSVVYLVDRPGSQQSVIFAGQLAPPRANPDEAAIAALQDVLGGSFTSRINMNLREDKHWSYGARTSLPDARGQRPYFVMAPVQADKTVESLREVLKELKAVVGENPLTDQELAKAKDQLTLSLPGRWETSRAVAGSIAEIVEFGLPPDYFNAYPAALRALTLDEVNAVARRLLHPEKLVWLVVGDRAAIEAGVRSLGFGEVRVIDADGKAVPETAGR
jgi:zinc protease